MDADTTQGKGAHERALAQFEAIEGAGVLLGTQMIAKGLDYPDVTLVGVINADTTLHMPDFRAAERTYQLLEQVGGRGGRGERPGTVIIQTYWPDHPAVRAVAEHDASSFLEEERSLRSELGFPPCGRLVNVLAWGRDNAAVERVAEMIAAELSTDLPDGWSVLGPSPAPLARLKGVWRWHVLLKAPPCADVSARSAAALRAVVVPRGISVAADVDPVDML
jgi:primosomal protein N' (replication factor Y)